MNNNLFWILAIIVVCVVLYSACAGSKETALAKEKIKEGAIILDVRTPQEFAGGAYPGARNIPVQDLQNRLAEVGPKDQSVVVYCRSGNRSGTAKKILEAAGYKDVTNAGGLSALQR